MGVFALSKYSIVFQGTVFNIKSKDLGSILKDNLFCISEYGLIERIIPPDHNEYEFIQRIYDSINKLKHVSTNHYLLPIESIKVGFPWNIQIIDTSKIPQFTHDEPIHSIFQKITYHTKPEDIKEVWIQGKLIHKKYPQGYCS